MLKHVKNKVIGQYIYSKLLYMDNKEVADLRIFLKSNGYKGGLKKKKYLENIGVAQTYLTFIVTATEEKSIEELSQFCKKLKGFELIQPLGIISKNSLVSDETGTDQGVYFSKEKCYKSVFFAQVVILAIWRKLLWKRENL